MLPRDLSTRSKRQVFIRILHEQADRFCEALVSNDPRHASTAEEEEEARRRTLGVAAGASSTDRGVDAEIMQGNLNFAFF